MFLVAYADRGLVSSGLNMRLYNTLFSLTWIVFILWGCFYNLEPFADTWNLINLIITLSIDAVIVELLMMKMRKKIDGMCLSQRYFSSIGGTKRRNLFTADECRHFIHILQFGLILEEALIGLPVPKETVKSAATLSWCMFLSVCLPLWLLYVLKLDPPLVKIHPSASTPFYKTTQVFTPRAATIDPPKKLNGNNEEKITRGCSVYFEGPQFRQSTERFIFVKPYAGSSKLESSSMKRNHPERSENRTDFLSLNVHELEQLQRNQEMASAREMMRRLEAKIENAKREFGYPPKIGGIPDVCIH